MECPGRIITNLKMSETCVGPDISHVCCVQGVATLVRAVQTFVDRRGVAVQAREFGNPLLISAPPKQDAGSGETAPDGGLPPVVSSGAVVITPVQLTPVCLLPLAPTQDNYNTMTVMSVPMVCCAAKSRLV